MSISRPVRGFVAALLLLAGACLTNCSNRLGPYRELLVGSPATEAAPPRGNEVQVTYLGTNGYLIRSRTTAIVVDPYFTRIPLRSTLFPAPVAPDPEAIGYALDRSRMPRSVDGFLVTHAHFDHLFDVPFLQRRLGGAIVTSKTGMFLCEASRVSRRHLRPSLPGHIHRIGDATVHVIPARHDRILGTLPYPGRLTEPLDGPPDRAKDWRLGTPLAFLVELEGRRIYVESGGMPGKVPSVPEVDLAIVGVAVAGSQERFPDAVRALDPEFVLPSHQDDFFRPIGDGFHFSALANFPRIKATHEAERLPGRLILMDYFHTWTVPGD